MSEIYTITITIAEENERPSITRRILKISSKIGVIILCGIGLIAIIYYIFITMFASSNNDLQRTTTTSTDFQTSPVTTAMATSTDPIEITTEDPWSSILPAI